jgi:hypothetical protein
MMTSLPTSTRWPDVPACHGWLALDRRGAWRLQGEKLTHAGLTAFLNAHYQSDASGAWFVRNGPQQVFVTLHYTPWVLRLGSDGTLETHSGLSVTRVDAARIDEEGSVILNTEHGPGLVDDRDLAVLFGQCRRRDGHPATDDDLLRHLEQAGEGLFWRDLPMQPIRGSDVARHFGFRPDPAP